MRAPNREPDFWANVDMSNKLGCWPWKGCKNNKGYGRLMSNRKSMRAHRIALLGFNESAESLCVLHRCDNAACCRPSHLVLGTKAENNADMRRKDRHARGERSPFARLSDEIVRDIKNLVGRGLSQQAAADIYGITQSHVSRINSGDVWKHLGS